MQSIEHLPEDEKQHYIKCLECLAFFDMRDLSQAFHHGCAQCLQSNEVTQVPFRSSRKIGASQEFLNGKTKIELN